VGGTVNLLHACRRAGVERLILASDATAVYAPAAQAVSERAGVAPLTPFGASKAAAETYAESFGVPAVVLRLASLYGPRRRTGVVARFTSSMVRGTPGTVYGDGTAARDLLHVEDAVDAFLRCLGGRADGRRLNVGTGVSTTVRALHSQLAALARVADAPSFAASRPGEPQHVALDSGSARRALGWEPSWRLEDGLAETVDWWRG
jgi:UDP-glucose 4-epimerase